MVDLIEIAISALSSLKDLFKDIEMRNRQLHIIVTGSSSGLGLAITKELQSAGHLVYGYDAEEGNDVRSPSAWLKELEYVDVLINCAGINDNRWFEEIGEEDFTRVLDVNAFSIVKMTQSVLPQLKDSGGVVINIVSNAANMPMTSSLSYCASKSAALMITRQMAHELTPKYGITVFSISPNKLAGTAMSKAIEDNVCRVRGWTKEYAAEYQKKALMHGLETHPEAIARLIGHLIDTDDMTYMSGCDIPFGK